MRLTGLDDQWVCFDVIEAVRLKLIETNVTREQALQHRDISGEGGLIGGMTVARKGPPDAAA